MIDRLWIRLAGAALMAVTLSFSVGCMQQKAESQVQYYQDGDLNRGIRAKATSISDATEETLAELNIVVSSGTEVMPYGGVIRGVSADGDDVVVRFQEEGRRRTLNTKLSIRVGIFGNEPLSWAIYNKVVSKVTRAGEMLDSQGRPIPAPAS